MKKINLIERLLSYSHEKQSPQRFGRYAVMLMMLLTLGVGQMWADEGFYGIYIKYNQNGTDKISDGEWTSPLAIGTLTADFKVTDVYLKVWWSGWSPTMSGQLHYWKDGNEGWSGSFNDVKDASGDNNHEVYVENWDKTIASTTEASGSHTITYKWEAYFSSTTHTLPSDGTKTITYTVLPPAVNSFSVARSGYLAGSGTSGDPYLVASGSNLTLTASGSQAHTDANSSINYKFGSDAYSTTATKNITVSSSGSIAVKARCINGTASLNGTETDEITIYYEPVSVKDISVYIYVGDCTDDQKNNLVLEGTPYIGTSAQTGVHIESAGFTTEGNWKKYTFSSVTKVHNLHVAGYAGANPLPNIEDATENFYYRMYNGTVLPDKCIQAPSLTWTTAPADGYVADGNLTAVVNTTPVSGGSPSVTWSTSNSGIANVNENTGEISYVAAGSATITAHVSWSATGDYCAGSQDLAQTITVSTPVVPTVTDASFTNNPIYTWEWVKISFDYASIPDGSYYKIKGGDGYYRNKNNLTNIPISGEGTENFEAACDQVNMINDQTWVVEIYNSSNAKITERTVGDLSVTSHEAVLGSITLSPNTTQNYAGSPIDITMSVTSTYIPNPVVIFYVTDNSNSTTYEVVATTGAIGSRPNYETTHTATFAASHAATYSVTAKVFTGMLVENFEVADKTTWSDPSSGTAETVSNPAMLANNGSKNVKKFTTTSNWWQTNLTRTSSAWVQGYQYIHTRWYYDSNGTDIRLKISDSPATELEAANGSVDTWNKIVFNNSSFVNIDFLYPFIKERTGIFYLDDIILSTESSMTARATQSTAATITVRDQYTITYKDQGNVAFSGSHVDTPSAHPTTHTYGTATTLNSATKTGYTFGGWFDNSACTGVAMTSIASSAAKDTTLYAKWTANTYTVQYNANGGTGDAMGNSDLTYNAGALSTNTYTRAGYTFSGWNTEANGGGSSYSDGQTNPNVSTTNGATVTLYAQWAARPYKIVYFAKPADWEHVYAYVWKESGTANNSWPGKQLDGSVSGTGTEVINCATYYYYRYYTDGGSEDAEGEVGSDTWDLVIFNNGDKSGVANDTKTGNLTINNGNCYGIHTGMQSKSTNGYSTSAKWTVRGEFNSWNDTLTFDCASESHSSSVLVEGLTADTEYEFKIWGPDGVAYKFTGGKDASYDAEYSITSLLDGTAMDFKEYSTGNNSFTTATTSYRFTLDVTDPKYPQLTVVPGDDADYTVTFATSGHGSISTPGTGSKTIHQYMTTTITAVPEAGYRFSGWTVTGTNAANVSITNVNSATTTVTATAAGATITANFTNEGIIYLDKSAISSSWGGTPYVYFYSNTNYWNNEAGTGSQVGSTTGVEGSCIGTGKEMIRIGDSQIWYYDYHSDPGSSNTRNCVVFLDKREDGYAWFTSCTVIRRSDFYPAQNMFVASTDAGVNKNKTAYYRSNGYWRKYNDTDPGYVVKIYDGWDSSDHTHLRGTYHFSSSEPGATNCEATVRLSSGTNYFKIVGCDTTIVNTINYAGTYYRDSRNGTMDKDNSSKWLLTDASGSNTGVLATATGDYLFTLTLGDGHLYISVDFPLNVGDFRVVYNGKMQTTAGSKKDHPSNYIRKLKQPTVNSDTTKTDIISFFVDPSTDNASLAPEIRFQWCAGFSGYDAIWRDTLLGAKIDLSGIDEAGIYNFEITQTNSQTASSHTISGTKMSEPYSGEYYIRTAEAKGGWKSYDVSIDNRMIYSDFAKSHSGYDYYNCHYIETDRNVKFTIANDYSECITDTLYGDDFVDDKDQELPYQANVRFMYNSQTNVIGRAYLNGSSDGAAEYLKIASNPSRRSTDSEDKSQRAEILDKNGALMVNNDTTFEDLGNWVYQIDIKALEGARVKLTSDYRYSGVSHMQYFKGAYGSDSWADEYTEQIIGGSANDYHVLRIVYDFKTNHMLSAWLVEQNENITATRSLNADVLILRTGHDNAKQITFGSGKQLNDVDTVYAALELKKSHMLDYSKSNAEREFYWVSFPYDVKINDIFGSVGNFNIDWAIQYYNGKKRAQNGYWIDSEPNWEFFESDTATLKANEGYVLTLALSKFLTTGTGSKWDNDVDSLYLYFPSAGRVGTILEKDVTLKIDTVGYKCTIDRRSESDKTNNVQNINKNRTIADSHWHCIGIPSFANVSRQTGTDWTTSEGDDPSAVDADDIPSIDTWTSPSLLFLYSWNMTTNKLEPVTASSYEFKALHAYLVQYGNDTIQWKAVSTPNGIAARRISAIKDQEFRLEVRKNDVVEDHTYIRFSDKEGVTTGFEFGQDLSKELNKNSANIYTFADYVPVAGNCMPLETEQTTIVPMGVKIATNGEYTFSMPEGTNGIGVILVDNVTGARTNLALTDYTIALASGTYDGRFTLEVSAIQQTPTDVENGVGANGVTGVRKAIVDGVLYIVKDGEVFDARGNRVQ